MIEKQIKQKINYCLNLTAVSVVLNIILFFTILLYWNSSPRAVDKVPDALSVSITTIEVFLVIVALGGFWMLRSDVRSKAEEVAMAVCSPVAEHEARETAKVVARRTVMDYIQDQDGNGSGYEMADAMDVEDS